jgi:predicted acyl esterase
MCASDVRYTDDAHYVGGAFALTGLKWATSMKVVLAAPPDPMVSGEGWKEEWRRRLDATPAIAARWLDHQTNDDYWRQGSVAVDYGAIGCPVYVVGGLVDSYQNQIPRLLSRLTVPRKGLYGPWQHGYPSPATPGPGLDWAWEELRWWRHWLMGEDTGVMEEPMLRAYMPDATAAQVAPGRIPGRWVAEAVWPSPDITGRRFHLGRDRLHVAPQPPETLKLSDAGVVGLGKVEWVPFAPTELPREQSPDDARSAVFDTPPLEVAIEILGAPGLRVRVASDRPVAHLAARLCEVTPDGRSWLVSYGLLNLTHRDGHEHPAPLEPGRTYEVALPLNFTAHRFAAGSRVRLALSQSLWPLVWPAPEVPTLSIALDETDLTLPVRPAPPAEAAMPIALAPAPASDSKGWPVMEITQTAGAIRVVETWPMSSSVVADIGETVSGGGPNVTLSMRAGDPLSCLWQAEQSARYQRPGWDVAIRSEVSVRADAGHYQVEERTQASLNGETVADVKHTARIARRLA